MKIRPNPEDLADIHLRVFWNTVMYETILVQELDLPPSGLLSLEDNVPIPKFIPFKLSSEITPMPDPDDSYYHQCHFLAQIANRIILTRIRHSLYLFCKQKRNRSTPKRIFHINK